jgi:hypothetical protein
LTIPILLSFQPTYYIEKIWVTPKS